MVEQDGVGRYVEFVFGRALHRNESEAYARLRWLIEERALLFASSMRRQTGLRAYSGVNPERRTTSRHIAVSLAAKAAASLGVLDKIRAPAVKNRPRVDSSAAISLCVVAIVSTIDCGVATGMT